MTIDPLITTFTEKKFYRSPILFIKMLKSTIISIISLAVPVICQVTEPSAVQFSTTSHIWCATGKKDYYISDGTCSSLPGKYLSVNKITKTCRGK